MAPKKTKEQTFEVVACKYCGNSVPVGSIFCCFCGERLARKKSTHEKKEIRVPEPKLEKSGKWRIYLREEKENILADSAAECKVKAQAIRAGFLEKEKTGKSILLTDAITNYIDAKRGVHSPSSIKGYLNLQKNRFPDLMHKDINTITDLDVQRAIQKEIIDGKSAKTIVNSWRFVQTVINTYLPEKTFKVSLPQIIPNEREFLDSEQIIKFLNLIYGTKIEVFALFALHSLRASEIRALTWENIDLDKNLIYVRGASVIDENGKLQKKKENKNKTSRRDIPIVIPRLTELLQQMDQSKPILKFSPNFYSRNMVKLCTENGLPHISPHCLRHSFASLALTTLQMPENIVMKLGGWSTPSTMKRVYTHVANSELNKHVESLKNYYQPQAKNPTTDSSPVKISANP